MSPAAPNPRPMEYLTGHGAVTDPISALGWGLLAISVAVFVITTALLIGALVRRRQAPVTAEYGQIPLERSGNGLPWIYIGTGISTVVLFGCAIWTMIVLVAVAKPYTAPALTLEVRGHMWWWEVRYISDDPSRIFTTANEIHIPVGAPVRVRLIGDDVIHAFWVPALAGKMQMIPGQTNVTWLEARDAGIYRGQCTQYCGLEHADMALSVIAEPKDAFEAWRAAQLTEATTTTAGLVGDGQARFAARCGACHAVRGTEAGGILGPDLTHLMSRSTIAAGTLTNNDANLANWIAHPQAIKPGNQMPDIDLSQQDVKSVTAFLETLK
jgi:cytochrome c oxidase subunit 2